MKPATRLLPPSRGIALLLAAAALALLVALGCRTTLSSTAAETPGLESTSILGSSSIDLDAATDDALLESAADHAQRQLPRQPLATPASVVVAILAMAAAVATGLRYTISSVPDAGRATSGLRPPPLLLRA
jgi:hypothetical protein